MRIIFCCCRKGLASRGKRTALWFGYCKTFIMKKKTCAEQGILIPSETKPPCVCPHWDSVHRACLLDKEGIFLPTEQHVASYCLSCYYAICSHYERFACTDSTGASQQQMPTNRRRSLRTLQHHIFRFSEVTGNDQIPGVPEGDGWTIDRSEHGIRFVGLYLLTPETTIRFSLEAENTGDATEGTGRVIWSEPLEKSSLFHSGIAFCDRPGSTHAPKPPSTKKM